MDFKIRTAAKKDEILLSEIGRQTYSDAFASQNTPDTMAIYLADAFNPQKQAEELFDPNSTFFLALDEDQVVGYARIKFGDAPDCINAKNPMEIIRFYSIKECIGKGVGKTLMKACLEHALNHGCDEVWLDVWQQNPRGIAFYKKWGFQIVGEQGFKMGNEIQQDYIMARLLSNI